MAGFIDLVTQAQPALFGSGVDARVTEGQTWRWVFEDIVDVAGDSIDLSTGITATCVIYQGTSQVLALDVDLGDGTLTIEATSDDTAGLANNLKDGRVCTWGLQLDDGTESVMVWAPYNSPFLIYPKTGVS